MTRSAWFLAALFVVLATCGGLIWLRAEGDAPRISGPEGFVLGRSPRTLVIQLEDDGSGLREASVVLEHAKGQTPVLARRFPGSALQGGGPSREVLEVALDPEALGLVEGDSFLQVDVRDWSWRGLLRGNLASARLPIQVDLRPPRVAVRSGLTYVRRGGSALVVYRVDESPARDGVQVGERFFPGQAWPAACPERDDRCRIALFAVAVDDGIDTPIAVVAEDVAGNPARAGFDVRIQERNIPRVPIRLSQRFLDDKVGELSSAWKVEGDPVAAFRAINERRRRQDEARIRELIARASAEPLWQGAFHQLPNSKVTSLFAERRIYSVDGQPISEATHFGFDLASTAAAPITASNAGRVLFADSLGIYGDCVLIDHGMGLVSLYGHLSSLAVKEGDPVSQDQVIGRTGATGFAGGDHLHFAILVGDTYVDPREWWDSRWVREHVQVRMAPAAGP